MKVSEIQIGDWVMVNDIEHTHPLQAAELFMKSGTLYATLYWDGMPEDAMPETLTADIDKVLPIPLTPEILEKNGFNEYIPENHLETVYACQDVSKAVADELYALWPYQDGSFYLLLRVNGKDMVRIDIHYIHQLQHALRLCGIEKEIIL